MTVEIHGVSAARRSLFLAADRLDSFESFFQQVGENEIPMIQRRTLRGVAADGSFFAPYSPTYAELREEYGLQTDHVDLFWTGQMFNAMSYEARPRQLRLFFMPGLADNPVGQSRVSNPEKAEFLDETREFFALSDEQIKRIGRQFDKYVDAALEGR